LGSSSASRTPRGKEGESESGNHNLPTKRERIRGGAKQNGVASRGEHSHAMRVPREGRAKNRGMGKKEKAGAWYY